MLFCDGYASVGAINPLLSSGCVFNNSKSCVQYSKIIFQSALIFKMFQDVFEILDAWRCFFAYGYGYRSNRLIQLYQVGVFYC